MSATEPVLLSISIYGLAIVISLLVAVVIRGIVVLVSRRARSEITPQPTAPAEPDVIQPSEVAAIAAALYAVMGTHRIVHVARADRDQTWTREGRSAHHISHNVPVRHRNR